MSIIACCGAQSLFINEVMSSNASFMADEDGDFSDWIEIYNGGSESMQLSNYSLSDDEDYLMEWSFPDTLIPAGEFMVVFASGKNRSVTGEELHTNFRVSADGEFIYLSLEGNITHTAGVVALEPNESFGLFPDGSNSYSYFFIPTPGGPNNSTQEAQLLFSESGGYFDNGFYLELSATTDEVSIYYTIDGGEPNENSLNYSDPLFLDSGYLSPSNINQIKVSPSNFYYPTSQEDVPKAIVIRAAAFDKNGVRISDVVTHSYFIESLGMHIPELPIVSLCGNHDDFFDENQGILVPGVFFNPDNPQWSGNYYLRGDAWERPINIEFFDNHETLLNQQGGLRTHGGNGRRFAQKALRLYARSEYGESHFTHQLFATKPIKNFKRLVLKPFSSSWSWAGIEDQITTLLAGELNFDSVGSRPVVLYLNGEYWGIYFLQERIDEHYIESNHSIREECVEMVENWSAGVDPDLTSDFSDLYQFIEVNDLAFQLNYEYVAEKMDIENFIDYQLFEIFIENYDWPANNMKCWKSSCFDDKWRWIFFDGDGALNNSEFRSFDHALSTSQQGWPTNATSTLFLRKLLENNQFYEQFLERMEALTETHFKYDNTSLIYQQVQGEVEDELIFQSNRFKHPVSLDLGLDQMDKRDNFLARRLCEFISQAENKFGVEISDCTPEFIAFPDSMCGIYTFPNPSNEEFFLALQNSSSSTAIVNVADITGRTVYRSSEDLDQGLAILKIAVETAAAKGVYLINVSTDRCTFQTKQLIIK